VSTPLRLQRCESLNGVPGIVHGFTDRSGGVSVGVRDSLHLGIDDAPPDELRKNWTRAVRRLHSSLGLGALAVVNQVHGNGVIQVDRALGPLIALGDADAMVCNQPGVVLAIRIADCVPVLLSTADGLAVGAVHSGWRGTASSVVRHAVRALRRIAPDTTSIFAAMGPHVSLDAYEVSHEVVQAISESGINPAEFAESRKGRWHVDLGAAVESQLRAEGVSVVERTVGCTSAPRWFSHRHDGASTGRQAALIARLP
jgi:polyphenol oxidase